MSPHLVKLRKKQPVASCSALYQRSLATFAESRPLFISYSSCQEILQVENLLHFDSIFKNKTVSPKLNVGLFNFFRNNAMNYKRNFRDMRCDITQL